MRRKTVWPVGLLPRGCAILQTFAVLRPNLPDSDFPSIESETQPEAVKGRLLSLDLGTKRVGVAVSDELQLTAQPLPPLRRSDWKTLLRQISELRHSFDAQGVVIGLPLNLDGTEGDAAREARRVARNLSLSLPVPVHLQDERLTSHAAEENLRVAGFKGHALTARLDSEAAAIILMDFITSRWH
jgi:putative Holliday junction resolvase